MGPVEAGTVGRRLLLIGAGRGADQVVDILRSRSGGDVAVGAIDDDRGRWGSQAAGVPVVGGAERLVPMFRDGEFDAAVVTISKFPQARRRFREMCAAAGIPLANVVDPTARIATDVVLGTGNIICSFCHIGTGSRVGDNNFFSAYTSFDHHNELGSDISTGPGCLTSGRVRLGDQVRLGTGIHIEPGVALGDRVRVASGAVILLSVPADHTVKTRILTTVVVPTRSGTNR